MPSVFRVSALVFAILAKPAVRERPVCQNGKNSVRTPDVLTPWRQAARIERL